MASKQDTMIDIGWIFVPLPGKSLIFEGLWFRRGGGGVAVCHRSSHRFKLSSCFTHCEAALFSITKYYPFILYIIKVWIEVVSLPVYKLAPDTHSRVIIVPPTVV